jgi:hypothetical protein
MMVCAVRYSAANYRDRDKCCSGLILFLDHCRAFVGVNSTPEELIHQVFGERRIDGILLDQCSADVDFWNLLRVFVKRLLSCGAARERERHQRGNAATHGIAYLHDVSPVTRGDDATTSARVERRVKLALIAKSVWPVVTAGCGRRISLRA